MEESKEKHGIIHYLFKLIGICFNILFPFFKIMKLNGLVNRCYNITKDQWFKKMKFRNYILVFLLLIVYGSSMLLTTTIISKDRQFSKVKGNMIQKTIKVYKISMSSYTAKNKTKTQKKTVAILFSIFVINSTALFFVVFLGLSFSYLHPSLSLSRKLRKELLTSGYLRKEDEKDAIIFATPRGFLVKIVGTNPKELVGEHAEKIWAPLNVTVRKWQTDPDDKTLVFFKKEFILKKVIKYEKL